MTNTPISRPRWAPEITVRPPGFLTNISDTTKPQKTSSDVALDLEAHHLHVLHYAKGMKYPARSGWQHGRCDKEAIRQFPPDANLGLLLNDLVDVDFDCPETLRLAHHLPSGWLLRFGKESTPHAHWLYRCHDGRPFQFREPKHDDFPEEVLVELRSGSKTSAAQSLCYGVHPNGERVAFEISTDPAPDIEFSILRDVTAKIATAALIARQAARDTSFRFKDAEDWLRDETGGAFADDVLAFVNELRGEVNS